MGKSGLSLRGLDLAVSSRAVTWSEAIICDYVNFLQISFSYQDVAAKYVLGFLFLF